MPSVITQEYTAVDTGAHVASLVLIGFFFGGGAGWVARLPQKHSSMSERLSAVHSLQVTSVLMPPPAHAS